MQNIGSHRSALPQNYPSHKDQKATKALLRSLAKENNTTLAVKPISNRQIRILTDLQGIGLQNAQNQNVVVEMASLLREDGTEITGTMDTVFDYLKDSIGREHIATINDLIAARQFSEAMQMIDASIALDLEGQAELLQMKEQTLELMASLLDQLLQQKISESDLPKTTAANYLQWLSHHDHSATQELYDEIKHLVAIELPNELHQKHHIEPVAQPPGLSRQHSRTALPSLQKISDQGNEAIQRSLTPQAVALSISSRPPSIMPSITEGQAIVRHENVQTISELTQLVPPESAPLIIFDLDETLVSRDVINGEVQRAPVNPSTRSIIQLLRRKRPKGRIIVMTKGDFQSTAEKMTAARVDEIGLFDDVEILKDNENDKGARLKTYLSRNDFKPDEVFFVDDTDGFLEQVEDACRDLQLPCQSFHFTGALPMSQRCNAFAVNVSISDLVSQHNRLHRQGNERIGKRFS